VQHSTLVIAISPSQPLPFSFSSLDSTLSRLPFLFLLLLLLSSRPHTPFLLQHSPHSRATPLTYITTLQAIPVASDTMVLSDSRQPILSVSSPLSNIALLHKDTTDVSGQKPLDLSASRTSSFRKSGSFGGEKGRSMHENAKRKQRRLVEGSGGKSVLAFMYHHQIGKSECQGQVDSTVQEREPSVMSQRLNMLNPLYRLILTSYRCASSFHCHSAYKPFRPRATSCRDVSDSSEPGPS